MKNRFQKGYIPWNKGKRLLLETRIKMSEARKKEWKEGKRSHWWRPSKEEKIKLSEKMKGNQYAKGAIRSDNFKKRVSEFSKGSKNYSWKDGRSKRKGYKTFLNLRRKLLKLKVGGSHTFSEWEILKAQYNWTCPCCYKLEPEIVLSEDHIIPLSKGGSNNIENIQPLCHSCNSKKNIKIIKYANSRDRVKTTN